MQKDNYEHVDHEGIIYISDALEHELRKGMAGDDAFLDTVKEQYSAESVRAVRYIVAAVKRAAPEIYALVKELEELEPYLEQELQKPEYGGKNLDELADESQKDERNWPVKGSLYMIALDAARMARDRHQEKIFEDMPKGTAAGVDEYVTTKDILSKAVFGEPGRSGKTLSIIREKPGQLTLWTTGKGKKKKEVTIYARLDPNEKALEAAGITIGKNLSKCAREVYGALLSHCLAGNNIISLGMVGRIIFNVRNGNDLTETQKKYITHGATEIFATSLFIDTTRTTRAKKDKNGKKIEESFISLLEAQDVNIKRLEQVFPGRITSAYINGNLVETAIELFKLPTLYKLQNALEKGHILRAPIEILEIPGRTDEDVITIRAYLLRRIDAMKHSSLSHMIIYKNILDEVGVDPTDRAQKDRKSRILKKTERVLDYWKEKGYIRDYAKLAKNGRPVKGTSPIHEIEIML